MKRTFSGSRIRSRGDGPLVYRRSIRPQISVSEICAVPKEAQEHIEYLSQFSAVQVLQWIDSWERSKPGQKIGKTSPTNFLPANKSLRVPGTKYHNLGVEESEDIESKRAQHYINSASSSGKEATELENCTWEISQSFPKAQAILSPPRSKEYRKHLPEIYACLFCHKTFGRKGDWKRHEGTIHEPQKQWHCPDCSQKFSAGNKFRRHHENDHGCDNCRHDLEVAFVIAVGTKSAWGCGFCVTVLLNWDDRANHIAFHFESGKTRGDWDLSIVIQSLLLQPGICGAWELLLLQIHGSESSNWPVFNWSEETSRDLLKKLQSNDLARNESKIAQLAYNLGSPTASGSESVALPPLENLRGVLEQQSSLEAPTCIPESTLTMVRQSSTSTSNTEHFQCFQGFVVPEASVPNDHASSRDLEEGSFNFDDYFNNMKDYTTPCAENFEPTAWFMWPDPFNNFVPHASLAGGR